MAVQQAAREGKRGSLARDRFPVSRRHSTVSMAGALLSGRAYFFTQPSCISRAMPYLTEHAVRLEPPSKYERFRRENDKFGEGIDAIWGITADGKVELQALRFDAKRYSVEDVRKWLKEHGHENATIEPATGEFSTDADADAVEREALLMEAGEYPDKGVTITEDSLQQMAESGVGAPVIVEHRPTLVLGWISELWRKGRQLWGKLRLKPHANQLVEESGVRGLSVGLARTENGFQLREVSLTATPRVANAQLFGNEPPQLYIVCANEARGDDAMETRNIAAEQQQPNVEQLRAELRAAQEHAAQLEARVKEMAQQLEFAQSQLVRNAVQGIVERYQREGKLTPAAAKHATELLMALATNAPDAIVQFSDDGHAEQLPGAVRSVIALLDALPAQPAPRATRFVGLGETELSERRRELDQELQRLGFSVSAEQLPDEVVAQLFRGGERA